MEGDDEVTESLVLPVQGILPAVYLVPASLPDQAVKEGASPPCRLMSRSRRACSAEDARRGRGGGDGSAVVCPAAAPGRPAEAPRCAGGIATSGHERQAVRVSSASWPAGWPPVDESVAQACAAA